MWALYEFLHNLNNLNDAEYFYLTVAVQNYIQPKLYTCSLCPKDNKLRAIKGCWGNVKKKVGQFKVNTCPGNHLQNIDYLLDYYVRWKRGGGLEDQPAKLVDILYFIDNRIEAHKESLHKEAERKAKARGVRRGHSTNRSR